MPAPKLGMWLFLASEAMFFIGLLGSFIVLESAGSQHQLFVNSSHMLKRFLGIAGVILLLFSSGALHSSRKLLRWVAIAFAILFIFFQTMQWWLLEIQETIVYRQAGQVFVSDGPFNSHKMPLPQPFDIHTLTAIDFTNAAWDYESLNAKDEILQKTNYGPSRNNFFAMYFLMSTAHVLHLLAGIIAVLWFLIFAKGKLPDAVQIYWHFVNAVGVISFLVLYFV